MSDKLYTEELLRLSKNPCNYGIPNYVESRQNLNNPLCGDLVELGILLNQTQIEEAYFEAKSCSLVTASAAILTNAIKGKSICEVKELLVKVESYLLSGDELELLPKELSLLVEFKNFPARYKCALLPWEALKKLLYSY